MPSRRFYRRRFLNRPRHHSGAHVIAEVGVHDSWRPGPGLAVEAELTLSDCNRAVVLDFSGDRPADWSNALHKAQLLRAVVCDFADALEQAVEEVRRAREQG